MSVSLSIRRLGFVLGALALVALVGCQSSSKEEAAATPSVTIKGKVTFDRIPVKRDVNGVPLGLETDPTKYELNVPARFVNVNLYRKLVLTDPAFPNDRSKDRTFFSLVSTARTNEGDFSFNVIPDQEWMVEVQSTVSGLGAVFDTVNLLADPNGLASTEPQQYRLRYCIRKAPDGTTPPTAPGVNHVATSKVTAAMTSTTVDFHIGLTDSWFLSETETDHTEGRIVPSLVPAYSPGVVEGTNLNRYSEAGQLEAAPTGSKILSILNAFSDLAYYQGTSIASNAMGPAATLDIHYLQGRSEAKGTFIEWDRSTYPESQVVDPGTGLPAPTGQSVAVDTRNGSYHYLGAVRGAAANDDAWDRGQLLLLAARAHVYLQARSTNFYYQSTQLGPYTPFPLGVSRSNLEPLMALTEGLPAGLAASVQKNPYLEDTSTGPVTYVDVRDLSTVPAGDRTALSAPLISALAWEMALKAKGITSPGTPTTWANILPATLLPLMTLRDTGGLREPINLYTQLGAMQGNLPGLTAAPTAPFTDATLQGVLSGLGIPAGALPWPRPVTGPDASYAVSWGTNPTSLPGPPSTTPIEPLTLSMAQAVPVSGRYDNTSAGELRFARFAILPTRVYTLGIELPNGPLTNGKVQVSFIGFNTPDGTVMQTYEVSDSLTGIPITFQAANNGGSSWLVRVRMISPIALQPDTTVKISLVPAP